MKLSQVIAQYIELKQSMGMRFRTEQVILRAFSKAMGDITLEAVEADRVFVYIAGTGPVTRFWHRKQEALRGFYRFAVGRGYVATAPLPTFLPKPPKSFVPYVYSPEELQRLLDATPSQENPRRGLQAHTLRTLLLLLYGAGLRLSEALHFTMADVDIENSLLVIRETKFYKTRLVPIGPNLTAALSAYSVKRQELKHFQSPSALFFITRTGNPVTCQMAELAFVRLRDSAGVHRHDGSRYQPRLHDLRHAFAVHRLISWYRQGADVQRLLPQLSTYLGHIHIAATQRYLTMTTELLEEASLRFERYAMGGSHHG